MGAVRRAGHGALLAFFAAGAARAAEPQPVDGLDPFELIRHVVRSQQLVEKAFDGATYDEREVRTDWDSKGIPKKVESKLYYVLAGENGAEGSRELVEVDGRPATPEEKKTAAEEDDKARRKRVERRAEEKARTPPHVSDDDDDPLVGSRRLSELVGRYTIRLVGEVVVEGRPAYVLDFSPNPRTPAPKGLGDRALNSLAGRAVIDAATFQIRSVDAHLTQPVKIGGGLAANVKDAFVAYVGQPVGSGLFIPCEVDFRVTGKTVLFFRLDTSFRAAFSNLRRFAVETETEVRPEAGPGSTP